MILILLIKLSRKLVISREWLFINISSHIMYKRYWIKNIIVFYSAKNKKFAVVFINSVLDEEKLWSSSMSLYEIWLFFVALKAIFYLKQAFSKGNSNTESSKISDDAESCY